MPSEASAAGGELVDEPTVAFSPDVPEQAAERVDGSVDVPDTVQVGLVRGDGWEGIAQRLGELTEIRVRHPERVAEGW